MFNKIPSLLLSEMMVLYDPDEDDASKWLMATNLMAHELVHQWFGNLVTPRWWQDEWLSEGITTYFTDLVLREVHSYNH